MAIMLIEYRNDNLQPCIFYGEHEDHFYLNYALGRYVNKHNLIS